MKMTRSIITRMGVLIGALFVLIPFAACVNSGVGGEGQGCVGANGDLCQEGLVCCDGTCVPPEQCGEIPDGDKEFGYEIERNESPLPTDGDMDIPEGEIEEGEENEIDGDVDNDLSEGEDEENAEAEEEVEQEIEYPIDWPESYGGETCTATGVCWIQPFPVAHDLFSIWDSPDDSLWIAGDKGTRIASDKEIFDGLNGQSLSKLLGVGGSDDTNVWAAGENATVQRYQGEENGWSKIPTFNFGLAGLNGYTFRHVHLDGVGNTYVLGEQGTLYRFFNNQWTKLNSATANLGLSGMWSIPQELYVIVGDEGFTLFSDNQYTFVSDPASQALTSNHLRDVYGFGADRVFAVGDAGTVLFHDGTQWWNFGLPNGDSTNLTGIDGNGDLLYLVGAQGTVYDLITASNPQYVDDETAPAFLKNHMWRKVDSPDTTDLTDVAVTPLGEIYVVGLRGTIWATGPGLGWEIINRPSPRTQDGENGPYTYHDITAMRGKLNTLYFGDSIGDIRYYNVIEQAWNEIGHLGLDGNRQPVNDIWVLSNGTVLFFNDAVYRWTPGESSIYLEADNSLINTVVERVWAAADNDRYAVGGRVVHFDGLNWAELTDGVVPWAGLPDGDVELSEVDGSLDPGAPTIISPFNWHGVWGESASNVWLVGDGSVVAQKVPGRADDTWRAKVLDTVDSTPLRDIWGADNDYIWIVGDGGKVWFSDGEEFTSVSLPDLNVGENPTRVWGTDEDHVFIVTDQGGLYLLRSEQNFERIDTGFNGSLHELAGPSFDNLYMGGEGGVLLNAFEIYVEEEPEVDGDEEADLEIDGDWETEVDGDQEVDVVEDDLETDGDLELEVEAELDDEAEVGEMDDESPQPIEFTCLPDVDDVCNSDCFCWENPYHSGNIITNAHAVAADDVWMCGEDGALLYYLDSNDNEFIQVLQGGPDYIDVAKRSETQIFLLTEDTLFDWDGEVATAVKSADSSLFKAIHLDGLGNLYLLEDKNNNTMTVHMLTDGGWSILGNDGETFDETKDIWAKDASNVYVVGKDVYRYNGTNWTSLVKPTAGVYEKVFGFADTNEIYVPFGTSLFHYDGSWETINYDSTFTVRDVWGTGSNDLYLVGVSIDGTTGRAVHFNGSLWSAIPDMQILGADYHHVFGGGASPVFILSNLGEIWMGDASAMTLVAQNGIEDDLAWITTLNITHVFAGGSDGVLWKKTMATGDWSSVAINLSGLSLPTTTDFVHAWASNDGYLFMATDQSAVVIYDNSAGTASAVTTSEFTSAVAGFAPDDFYVGPTLKHYDGSQFSSVTWGAGASDQTVVELWTDQVDQLFGVGPDGVSKLNGTSMDVVYDPSGAGLTQITGINAQAVYAAGFVGGEVQIVTNDSGSWRDISGDLPLTLVPVDLFAAGDLLFLLADNAGLLELYLYDSTSELWQPLEQFPTFGMKSMSGFGRQNVYSAGIDGIILQFKIQGK